MNISIPPIKSQGIKTKLLPAIAEHVPSHLNGRWIEPFMGTGVVGFNLANKQALMCDSNPHLIHFYQSLADGHITALRVRQYLKTAGQALLEEGESYYYAVRARFNKTHDPLDFLFLNRACFNGMIRFNRKGEFNTPFCRKPQRFLPAYISKIANQTAATANLIRQRQVVFKCQSFEETIAAGTAKDIIYCDPPYIDRHADYYNRWNADDERRLYDCLASSKSRFILSTWHHNTFRHNQYIEQLWNHFHVVTREHFYHLGGHEHNRNSITEAIVSNYPLPQTSGSFRSPAEAQLTLLEKPAKYL